MTHVRRHFALLIVLTALPVLLAWRIAAQRAWMPKVRRMYSESVQSLRFSPDGRHVIATGTSTVLGTEGVTFANQIEADSLNPMRRLTRVSGQAENFVLSPDDKMVGQIVFDNTQPSRSLLLQNHVELRDAANNKLLWKNRLPSLYLNIVFSPHGEWLAATELDQNISLYSLQTQKSVTLAKAKGDLVAPCSISFLADGHYAISGSRKGDIDLWATATWRCMRSFHVLGVMNDLSYSDASLFALSSDRRWLAVGHDKSFIDLYDFASGIRRFRLPGATQNLAFSPDGSMLASGDKSGTLTLWDTHTGTRLRTMSLAVRDENHGAEPPFENPEPPHAAFAISIMSQMPTGKVTALAWSPEGNTLVSGHDDGTIARWKIK